jgi:hypothetical protein
MHEVHIYNVYGQEVFSSDAVILPNQVFDVSHWKAGIYFLRLGKKENIDYESYRLEIVH